MFFGPQNNSVSGGILNCYASSSILVCARTVDLNVSFTNGILHFWTPLSL